MQREGNAPVSTRRYIVGVETWTWVLCETLHSTDTINGHLKSEIFPDLQLQHFLYGVPAAMNSLCFL